MKRLGKFSFVSLLCYFATKYGKMQTKICFKKTTALRSAVLLTLATTTTKTDVKTPPLLARAALLVMRPVGQQGAG